MIGSSGTRLRLADYLTALRSELDRAGEQAEEDGLRYDVDTASIEIDIAYSFGRSETPEFWVLSPVLEEMGEIGFEPPARQRLTVRLPPRSGDATGPEKPGPGESTALPHVGRAFEEDDT